MSGFSLPALNASLNLTAAVLLSFGLYFIRHGNVAAHKRCMIAAFCVSTAFLISYLIHHARAGHVRFSGVGPIRTVYLWILLTHTVLAAVIAPMAIVTLRRALRGRFVEHRRLARWTWPIWIYVSVTGVVIYWMLYRL